MNPGNVRQTAIGIAGALVAAIWATFVSLPHLSGQATFYDQLEASLTDLRFSTLGSIGAPDDVVVVAIDDATLADETMAQMDGRQRLARIITRVGESRPGALAVDIVLTDSDTTTNDTALAESLQNLPAVIAAAGRFGAGATGGTLPQTRDELWPQPVFSDAADVGLVNIVTDVSGTPRHVPLLFLSSRGIQPSLVLQAAALFRDEKPQFSNDRLRMGEHQIPLDFGFHMPVRLAGPSGTVPTISALDIVNGADVEMLAGKMVVLGVTATALGDRFYTPFDANTPGVEIVATALSQLLGAPGLRRDPAIRQVDFAATVVLAFVCAFLVLRLPLSRGGTLAIGALVAWVAAIWFAFSQGLWLSAALPVMGVAPPMMISAAIRYRQERRRAATADRAVTALRRFQSPALAEMIEKDPDFLARPVTRDLIVFFVDLSGFTGLSQSLGPQGTEDFLKRFHTVVTQDVHDRHGVVLNYMGDGALAVFGIDANVTAPADDAMMAAFSLVEHIRSLGITHGFKNPLGSRIGVHAGPVVLSRLGDENQQQVSVTGDSVNLASRLMEIAKSEGASIAATADLLGRLQNPAPGTEDKIKTLPVRGRAGSIDVHLWD